MEETALQSGRNPNYISLLVEPVCKPSEQRKPETHYTEINDGYEQPLSCSEQKADPVYNDIDETQLQATPECQRDEAIRPQPPVRREMTQVSCTMCHCKRFVVLLVVALIVVTVIFSVVVAKFLIGGGDPTTTPIITTTPINRTTPNTTTSTREEFYGRMWLDALQYDPSTYGKSTSPEYQQLETKFCSKTKATLSEKGIKEIIDKCEVTTFSKGSVVVHFTIFTSHVLVWRDTQKMLTDTLLDEMEKKDGQFHEYLKKGITPKVTFNADDTASVTTTHIQSTTKTTFQSPMMESTSNRPTATTTMTTPTTKSSMTTTNPTTTKTTTNPTTTTTPIVEISTLAPTYCQIHSPCKNGGTCVNLVGGNYVCVCHKCNCSSVEPFGDCEVDMATICHSEGLPARNSIPHPYDCRKYVKCTSEGRVSSILYVWNHENNRVFNPVTGHSEPISNVPCAKEIVVRTICVDVTCANGDTCEDTRSGFKCHNGHDLSSTTPKKISAPTYCQIHSPCQNGGTCVNLVGGSYVCVCPKCNCSSVAPFGNCEVDMATICRPEDLPPHNLVPHPYDCQKYVKCMSDGRATTIEYVWEHYNNRVFNPDTDLSEQLSNVRCAREKVVRHVCADVTCANGGRCEDTPSGFKCH